MDRLRSLLEGLRTYWSNLSARERLLLGVLGGLLGMMMLALPVYLLSTSIGELEDDNAAITAALRRMSRSREQIAAQRAEQATRDARYAVGIPGTTWLQEVSQRHGLTLTRVDQEPDRIEGGFKIRHTRAEFQNVGLRAVLKMVEEIENSRYPVAVGRLHFDHNPPGDNYRFTIGILTYERLNAPRADAGAARGNASRARRAAGPAAP